MSIKFNALCKFTRGITAGKNKRRQTMRNKLSILGLMLVLSSLIVSGCGTATPTEVAAEVPPKVREARDAALAYVGERYGDQASTTSLNWTEENVTPEDWVGSVIYEFTARDWVVTIYEPVLPPERVVRKVTVANETNGFRWEGKVDAAGQVFDAAGPVAEQPTKVPTATTDWKTYTNERYGYSLRYPPDCTFGPMPKGCKQKPPEERPPECLCFLDAQDPDQVHLEAFTGEKDDLKGAAFWVTRPAFDPPPGTDLIEYMRERYPSYENIPNEPNVKVGGIPAVRLYTPPSPMAFSSEEIYFIKDDKLFRIYMQDVDEKTNRELYDRISFALDISMEPPTIEQSVVGWYGYVASTPDGAQFDDYLVLEPKGTGEIGLEGVNAEVEAEIVALRDKEEPGRHAHFWGTLTCDVLDYGGCQLLVTRLRPDGPGPFFDADPVEGWEGTIYSGPPGLQVDDYYVLVGDLNVRYGIWSPDSALNSQLESLRDTGTVVRVWGQVVAGVMDGNGTQVQVERFEIVDEPSGAVPPPPDWPEADDGMLVYVNEVYKYQFRYPPTATITEFGVEGFPGDELPEGMSAGEYLAQLQEQYGNKLCVQVEYALGYLVISAPPNKELRYATCRRTGVGVGEIVAKTEEVTIDGQTYTAVGFEAIGADETLPNHNETLAVELEDGTVIEYGARPEPTATYEDYLMKGKGMLLHILASYEPLSN
jgi:hypothetical protein